MERRNSIIQYINIMFRFDLLGYVEVSTSKDCFKYCPPSCPPNPARILHILVKLTSNYLNMEFLLCVVQGGTTCGAIEGSSRSLKAIDKRVFTNFCDKYAVFTNFCDKNAAFTSFCDKIMF